MIKNTVNKIVLSSVKYTGEDVLEGLLGSVREGTFDQPTHQFLWMSQ